MIWVKEPITAESMVSVSCVSSVSSERIVRLEKQDAERQLTSTVLMRLSYQMETAGIEKFDGDFYHGLINPLDVHDLLSTVDVPLLDLPFANRCLEYVGFRLKVTTVVSNVLLFGKTSSVLKPAEVFLLNPKDVPIG